MGMRYLCSVLDTNPGKLLVTCLDHTSQVQTTRGYYDAVRGAIGVLPLAVSHRFVALKVTFSPWRHRVIATVHTHAARRATNLRLQRLNDVMAAKMRSSSIEPKPADEDAETAGLD